MNLYRGLTGILFKHIDPFFKGNGEYNSYGAGTSYSTNKETAHQYATNLFDNKIFGYLLSYTASNLNVRMITPENFIKQCDSEFMKTGYYRLYIDGHEILSNELSSMYLNEFNALDINESHAITTGRQIFIIDDSVLCWVERLKKALSPCKITLLAYWNVPKLAEMVLK